jgi:hypothetical protein
VARAVREEQEAERARGAELLGQPPVPASRTAGFGIGSRRDSIGPVTSAQSLDYGDHGDAEQGYADEPGGEAAAQSRGLAKVCAG